jgi:hypothetical protein
LKNAQLNSQDSIRLHVLASQSQAIRLNESNMVVYGIQDGKQHSVQLRPTCKDEQYVKLVRELLSSLVIDHPNGYPVFLGRWSRMGQLNSGRLSSLLRLAEPEAVVAVASSQNISAELAELAWWANPNSEVARFLLQSNDVAQSPIGLILAHFLLEYLPFETDPENIAQTTFLVLHNGLLTEEQVSALWQRGNTKTSILLGFLRRGPTYLNRCNGEITSMRSQTFSNPQTHNIRPEDMVEWAVSIQGRSFFHTAMLILKQPANPFIVTSVFEEISKAIGSIQKLEKMPESITAIMQHLIAEQEIMNNCFQLENKQLKEITYALNFLALIGESLLLKHFSRSTAVGSLMRKQLQPVLCPVIEQLRIIYQYSETRK